MAHYNVINKYNHNLYSFYLPKKHKITNPRKFDIVAIQNFRLRKPRGIAIF